MNQLLAFPDLEPPLALARSRASCCSAGVLSAEIEGMESDISRLAGQLRSGPMRALFGEQPVKLLRFTVLDQGTRSRLVFLADYRTPR